MTTDSSDDSPNLFLANAKTKPHQVNENGQPEANTWHRI